MFPGAVLPRPEKSGGFTPEQRFFLSYGQVWKVNMRPETLRLLLATNPHSPGRYRVMGPVSNLPEFAQAFPCETGKTAAAGDQAKVQIW